MSKEKTSDISRSRPSLIERSIGKLPGVFLCSSIALIAFVLERIELHLLAFPYIGAVVIAILIGIAIRSFWIPPKHWKSGIDFSAKQLLEIAIVLLGASISFPALLSSGPLLIATIVATVLIALAFTYHLGRILGLSQKLSLLIACGNSICGNSAIATVAPVIGADSNEVAASVSFTAILGVLVVLGLPLLIPLLHLSQTQYGILAGLTVYAVPQVLATTLPTGLLSTQVGTLVKLVRVLMLGPIVVGISLFVAQREREVGKAHSVSLFKIVPWFIIGFLAFGLLRSFGLFHENVVAISTKLALFLTIISMAALGLGVDLRVLGRVGGKVTIAVTLSLMLLLAMSIGTIQLFN